MRLIFEGYGETVHAINYYFEYRENLEKKKRKRSFCVSEDNDEIIDKAFKSRLIQKLGFQGCPDYDMNLFGDDFGESWSNYKDNLEKDFSDSTVLDYLENILSSFDSEALLKVKYFNIVGT